MITVTNLTKKYGKKAAVDNISFTVNEGEIVGFLGPNGAGKTTTMNILTGYLSMSSGSASVGGFDILENPNEVKKLVGYLPEHPPLYSDMTVDAYLKFVFKLKKCKDLDMKSHVAEICDVVKLSDVRGRIIGHLSKGYQQRVGLAQALIGNPPVLILDEPTVGLDPRQIIEIRDLIKDLGKQRTVILSSHILPEVQAVCGRIIVINRGRLVADDSAENLTRNAGGKPAYSVTIDGAEGQVIAALRGIAGVTSVKRIAEKEKGTFEYLVEAEKDTDIRKAIFNVCVSLGTPLIETHPVASSLEDVFINLTGGSRRAPGGKAKRSVKKREEADL
ncbi:MAG: ATP-binding cassette domain-containing protein [Clostridia bacterium]|nr:ATP-binding cassette domain-containing protein [Clostridia bacterium]